jgi:hypothetical protein
MQMKQKPVPVWRAILAGGCVVEGYDFRRKKYRIPKPKTVL